MVYPRLAAPALFAQALGLRCSRDYIMSVCDEAARRREVLAGKVPRSWVVRRPLKCLRGFLGSCCWSEAASRKVYAWQVHAPAGSDLLGTGGLSWVYVGALLIALLEVSQISASCAIHA